MKTSQQQINSLYIFTFFTIYCIIVVYSKLVEISAELPYGLVAGDINGWTVDNGGAANTFINTCYNGDSFGPFGTTQKAHKTFTGLAPHWSIGISFEYYIAWTWDNEFFYFDLDSTRIRDEQYSDIGGQPAVCSGGSGNDGYFYNVGFNITHTSATALLEFYSNLDSANTDEAFLINNLIVSIDECHSSCLTCNGPDQNQCLTCPTNSNKYSTTEYGEQCLCDPGYVADNHACVNTGCPAGTSLDYVTKTCNIDCPIPNCTTCVNELCTICSGAYKLLNGYCYTTCPFYTTTSGSSCVDSDYNTLALTEQPYVIQEFNEQYFSHSQLISDGWVSNTVETDNTVQYNPIVQRNCNSESLVLGFQNKVTGNCDGTDGCYVKKTYTDLPPHFRATIKVQFLSGDTWDGGADDYYEIIVDNYSVDQQPISNAGATVNMCGNLNGDNDQLNNFTPPSFTHYTTSLEITLKYRVNSGSLDEWGGFRELQIILQKCHPNCLTCNNASTCLTCIPSRTNAPNCNLQNTGYLNDGTVTGPFPPCENQCLTCTGTAGNCATCTNPKASPNDCDAYTTCFLYGTVTSQGFEDGNILQMFVNGVNIGYTITNGLGVQIFDTNSVSYSSNNFNTHNLLTESDDFYKLVDALDIGTIVMVGIKGNGQENLNPNAYIALQQLGFSDTEKIDYYDGFAMIGIKNKDPNPDTSIYRIQKRGSLFQEATVTQCMVECNINCLTCIGGINQNDCQSCAGPNYLQLDIETSLSQCVATCYDNYYPNNGSRSCLDCQVGCKICTAVNNCSECKVGYYLHTNNLCYTTCPNLFYGNPNTKMCDSCHSSCETCTGPTQADCTLCLQSPQMFKYSVDNQCYLTCPDTTEYGRVSDSTCQSCVLNSADCVQCTDINTCTKCQAPSFLVGGYCLPNCPVEQFYEIGPPDNICQPCVANCKTCSAVDPTICLSCYPDRFYKDQLCKICEDFIGLSTDPDEVVVSFDKCVEKCGDGIVVVQGFDGCDDGNNIDGDGCSFDCKIESGYICKGGNPFQKDICFDQNPVRYSISYSKEEVFEENKQQNAVIYLDLVFTKEFIIPSHKQIKDYFAIKFVESDSEFKDFKINILNKNLSQTEFIIELYLETSLKNRELLLYFNDVNDFQDYLGNKLVTSQNILKVNTFYHYTDQQRSHSSYLKYFIRTYIGIILIYIAPLILINKFWIMQNVLDNCQLIYLLGFIKLRQPINGQVFHQEMKAFSDLWMGNPLEYQQYIDQGQQESENIKSESFMERGYTHNIFNNLGGFMLLLVSFVVLHVLLRILLAFVQWMGRETLTKRVVQESIINHPFFHKLKDILQILVYEFYEFRFMHNFWEGTYIIFTLFAFLNLRDFKVNVSSITAAVISVVCLLTPIIISFITYYCRNDVFVLTKDENGKEDPLLVKIQNKTFKFRTFWQQLNVNKSKSMVYFQLLIFMKRLLYAVVIIVLEGQEFLQISIILFISLGYLIFISITRPYLRFTDNLRIIIVEITGIVGIGLQYRMLSDDQEDESIRYYIFQDVLICFTVCILLNVFFLLYDTWWVIFYYCLPNCRNDDKLKVTNLREVREEYLQENYKEDEEKIKDEEDILFEKKQKRARPYAKPKKQVEPDLVQVPLQLGNIYEEKEKEEKYKNLFQGNHFLQQNTKKVKRQEDYEETKNKIHQLYERKHQEQNNMHSHFTQPKNEDEK